MSFTPAIPLSGYAGWAFLKRTMPIQQASFNAVPQNKRDEDYFREKIGSIKTAEALVNDRRLLKVALGAFGLDNDINNKFFIQKVLQDGTLKETALANKLADKQYEKFSAAFGFGNFSIPNTALSDFPNKIIDAYRTRQFEAAVGTQNNDLRLALNIERELPAIAGKAGSSENAKWFTVMGNTALRTVFQTALGLPSNTATLDLDQQLGIFKSRAKSQFGSDSVSQFTNPAAMDALIKKFLVRSEVNSFAQSGNGNATLLLMSQAVNNARNGFR